MREALWLPTLCHLFPHAGKSLWRAKKVDMVNGLRNIPTHLNLEVIHIQLGLNLVQWSPSNKRCCSEEQVERTLRLPWTVSSMILPRGRKFLKFDFHSDFPKQMCKQVLSPTKMSVPALQSLLIMPIKIVLQVLQFTIKSGFQSEAIHHLRSS